jgi:predicted ATP-grasp superfamily ATP-dependent carboligase
MNSITNLKIENSQLVDKAKKDDQTIQYSQERLKKLEWFYKQAKAKKYRNCGS